MPQSNRLHSQEVYKFLSENSELIEVVTRELLVHHSRYKVTQPSSMSTGTEPPSPALPAVPTTPRESRTEAAVVFAMGVFLLIPSLTLERRASGPHPLYPPAQNRNRLASPLSHSQMPSSLLSPSPRRAHASGEGRSVFGLSSMHLPPMRHSSTSTVSDSVVTTLHSRHLFSTTNLRTVSALEKPRSQRSSNHPRQVNCWFRTAHHTFLTTRQFKFAQQSPPSPQIYFECARATQLGPETKRSFPESNASPLRSSSGCPTSPPISTSQILRYSPPTSSTLVSSSSRYQPSMDNSPQRANISDSSIRNSLTPSCHLHPHRPRMTDLRWLMPIHIKYMRSFFSEKGRTPASRRRNESHPWRFSGLM